MILIQEFHEIGFNPELLYGSNEVLQAARNLIESRKPLNVQEHEFTQKGVRKANF